jgi:Tfp pilus assembly protein PilF
MLRRLFLLAPLFLLAAALAPPGVRTIPAPKVTEAAAALRTLGLAQLENERPGEAAETFRKLAALTPDDPLPYADLAVAALRQQKSDEAASAVAQALSKAPGRADLLALQGDVLQWSGKDEEALALYRKAAAAGPDQVVIQYALYRRASQGTGPDADAALREALAALVRLRPENLVVLLQSGQRAVAAGDRAGATQAFLRVRELIESAPSPAAATVLGQVLTALEGNDLAAARVPAIRLENVLKPTPAYQQGLRELAPGILGNPVERFATEPPPASFGDPISVRFKSAPLAAGPVAGRALATGDFDGDGKPDLVALTATGETWIFLNDGKGWFTRETATGIPPYPGGCSGYHVRLADLDRDARAEIVAAFAGENSPANDPDSCPTGGGIQAWHSAPAGPP